jgi:hypothetical protein
VENLIAKETYRNDPDSLKAARERIFNNYNITQPEYEKIISSYSSDKEEWNEFYNLAGRYIDSLQAVEDSTN